MLETTHIILVFFKGKKNIRWHSHVKLNKILQVRKFKGRRFETNQDVQRGNQKSHIKSFTSYTGCWYRINIYDQSILMINLIHMIWCISIWILKVKPIRKFVPPERKNPNRQIDFWRCTHRFSTKTMWL